jgi:hypothetical protein
VDGRLPAWTGNVGEAANLGCYLEAGDWLCEVGDSRQWDCRLVIDQADLEFVRVGQVLRLVLDAFPLHGIQGTIHQVSSEKLSTAPWELSAAAQGDLETVTGADGSEQPLFTSYEATGRLRLAGVSGCAGLRGRARITVDHRPLGSKLLRFLAKNLRFR